VNTIEYGSNLSDTEYGKIKNDSSDSENMRSDSEDDACLQGRIYVLRNNTHTFSPNKCHKIIQCEMKKVRFSFLPENTGFQQRMPTNRNAALCSELNSPPQLWNQIPREANRHRENLLKGNTDHTKTCIHCRLKMLKPLMMTK
jgi:hypothetical protein